MQSSPVTIKETLQKQPFAEAEVLLCEAWLQREAGGKNLTKASGRRDREEFAEADELTGGIAKS